MNWILILVIAYFLIAIASLVDKFLLTKAIPEPVVYLMIVSTIGLLAVLLAPFGFFIPSIQILAISAIAGGGYTLSIFFLYKALRKNEASRIFTFVGALVAVFTFILSFLFLDERLGYWHVLAFIILLFGGALVSLEFNIEKNKKSGGFGLALIAAFIFAISYTATKYTYSAQVFVSGFVWIRIFAFVAALLFLFSSKNRELIKKGLSKKSGISKKKNQIILAGGQVAVGIGFLLLNYVISLTSASIVLAAQGLQYAFLLIFSIIISIKFPKFIKEEFGPKILTQKISGVLLIAIGLIILAVNII